MLIAISLISLLIALPGFINKAGYSLWKGFIPFYNIYLFFRIIEFPPIVLMLCGIGMIILPDRAFIITLLCCLLPFFVCEIFNQKKIMGFITLLLPFIMYPLIGYIIGFYSYDTYEDDRSFFDKHKVLTVMVVAISFYVYYNFTMIVGENKHIDKTSVHYVNDLYMSNGYVYNNHLNKNEQTMYMYLFKNTKEYKETFTFKINEFSCPTNLECNDLLIKGYEAVLVDHPELINYAGLKWSYGNNEFKVDLDFSVGNELKAYFGETRIKRIINNIKRETKDMEYLEKVKYVYDWIGKNSTYDQMFTYASKNQSIYNVFMKKNAVCAGFAKASQVIFQNIGVNSMAVSGQHDGVGHMWNLVEYKGKWYYYDSTVAACRKYGSASFYDGLKSRMFKGYTIDYEEWYPEISNDMNLG